MTQLSHTDLFEPYQQSYYQNPYQNPMPPTAVPNIQKMMFAIIELQQKLTEVSTQCDMLFAENAILKATVNELDAMRK